MEDRHSGGDRSVHKPDPDDHGDKQLRSRWRSDVPVVPGSGIDGFADNIYISVPEATAAGRQPYS